MEAGDIVIPVREGQVSALWLRPEGAKAAYLLAHGAGAGMRHQAMAAAAAGLAGRGFATLRFQFPYMEKGSKRPDPPAVAQAAVRAAAEEGARLAPDLPWFAGGRSFGGRMTSEAQAEAPLPGVRGLLFLGFPLHPAGKPGIARAQHLARVKVPMLFLSGTRDALAETDLLRGVVEGLGDQASLHLVEGADHGFNVLVRSGRKPAEAEAEVWDKAAAWMAAVAHRSPEDEVVRSP
ncbi:alpha/beta hydrolase family protein [Sphingosinicella terrae]|uniref:alpha/beta hydrolase family protein n=1 Tax=Sphingosinicella terrae TaxID=2172047 RepID=UPI002549A408|nr:alpha/beta family hydrolase [Sphingosinicella terrae]